METLTPLLSVNPFYVGAIPNSAEHKRWLRKRFGVIAQFDVLN